MLFSSFHFYFVISAKFNLVLLFNHSHCLVGIYPNFELNFMKTFFLADPINRCWQLAVMSGLLSFNAFLNVLFFFLLFFSHLLLTQGTSFTDKIAIFREKWTNRNFYKKYIVILSIFPSQKFSSLFALCVIGLIIWYLSYVCWVSCYIVWIILNLSKIAVRIRVAEVCVMCMKCCIDFCFYLFALECLTKITVVNDVFSWWFMISGKWIKHYTNNIP